MISNDCTNGTPAASIVANWRANTAISPGVIFCTRGLNKGFALGLMPTTLMPIRRNSARAITSLLALMVPLVFLFCLSKPSQLNSICSSCFAMIIPW